MKEKKEKGKRKKKKEKRNRRTDQSFLSREKLKIMNQISRNKSSEKEKKTPIWYYSALNVIYRSYLRCH